MSFLAPAWLLLCAAGALVLLLHARQRKTFEIPSIQLWRQLESGHGARRRIRPPPFNLLLLLQLLVTGFCALALAQPLIGSGHALPTRSSCWTLPAACVRPMLRQAASMPRSPTSPASH